MALVEYTINNPLPMQVTPADWPGGYWWHWLFFTVVIIAFVLIMVMGARVSVFLIGKTGRATRSDHEHGEGPSRNSRWQMRGWV